MLQARPVRAFSRDYHLEDDGRTIATLDVSWWKDAGTFAIDGTEYSLSREHLMDGAFVLQGDGEELARATKPSAFRSRFDLEIGDGWYSLARTSALGRAYRVVDEDAEVGTIRPAGWLTRRALVDLPSEWPLPVQVFVFWLVLVMWNRDETALAVAAAAS